MTSIKFDNSNKLCSLTRQNLERHIQTFADTLEIKQQDTLAFATIQQSRIGTDYYSHFEPNFEEETTTFKSVLKKHKNMRNDKKPGQQKTPTPLETDLVSEDEEFISTRLRRGIPVERVGSNQNTSLKKRSAHLEHNHKLSDDEDDNSNTNDSYLEPRSHQRHKSKRTQSSSNKQVSRNSIPSTTKKNASANKSKFDYKKKGRERVTSKKRGKINNTKSLMASSRVVQNFISNKIGSERITLKSKDKSSHHGIFNKGKASKKVVTKGVPDLVFSEVHFLDDDSRKRTCLSSEDESYSLQYPHPVQKKRTKVTTTVSEESLEKSSLASSKSNSIFEDYMIIDVEPPKRSKVTKTKATSAKLFFENHEKNNSNMRKMPEKHPPKKSSVAKVNATPSDVFLEKDILNDELNEIDTISGESSMPQQSMSQKKDELETSQTDIEKILEPIDASEDKKELQTGQEIEQIAKEPPDNEEQDITPKDSLNTENDSQSLIIRMINDLDYRVTDNSNSNSNNNCNDFNPDVHVALTERNLTQDYDFDEIIGDCDVTDNITRNIINLPNEGLLEIENAIQMIDNLNEDEKDENEIYFFDSNNKHEWLSEQPIGGEENSVSRSLYDDYSDNLQVLFSFSS
ncbi:6378_t:CDS:2 [Ambispora gerdemannii]|uniref:6378_t:CDS:1 n=1 Tax=Ambispora gerdemannii TaxID=144530 RepID=A0A9N8V1V9_9GLOM|nr:6378_t:CDS:2 [Ambispora gerdemannii]